MKKMVLFIFLCLFMIPISVRADHMYRVDMKINILQDGTANIEEVWDVKATSGSEWYKTMYDLGNSELSNFVVYMDGNKLSYVDNWDVDASLKMKSMKYGINYTYDGLELCFGKSDMKRHKFTLKYTLSNYVFNTLDSQVLYWTLLPKVELDDFSVEVSSYYDFPDALDVWGYGYKGYAYVENGKIKMSNEGSLNNDYVVLLAKFPAGTFNTSNVYNNYGTFDSVFDKAEEDTFEYDYNSSSMHSFFDFIMGMIPFFMTVFFVILAFISAKSDSYGYLNNKKINKKEVPMFRDIPCNKDIYYANTLIKLNNFGYKESNILGAIILKWIKNNKISFKNEKVGIFNKETSIIDLSLNPVFDNELEKELFDMMYEASKDGLLETKEFERWCRNNYSEFFRLFKRIENKNIDLLKKQTHIYHRVTKKECKKKYVMDDKMYEDSVRLYGLKKYLEEFSRFDTKEVMEVKLWDEYLMFAYLFGIADRVAKQLKDMYPEVIEEINSNNNMMFDYDMFVFVNNISTRSVYAASSARSAAQSYSAGGGGFSSGGGGGGSFGGGGGSMGGR